MIRVRPGPMFRTFSQAGSLVLVCLLAWQAGLHHLHAAHVVWHPGLSLLALLCAAVGFALLTFKWQSALRFLGVCPAFHRLAGLTLTAQLWNLLLPAQIGGEVYRAGQLVALGIPLSVATSAALLDRGSTAMAIALVGLVSAVLGSPKPSDIHILVALLALVTVPFLGYALLHHQGTVRLLARVEYTLSRRTSSHRIGTTVQWLLQRPLHLTALLVLAVASQIFFSAYIVILGRGLGTSLTLPHAAWAMSASALLPYLIPLPGSTTAVQMGSFVYLLVQTGTPQDRAALLSLAWLATTLGFGCAGGVLDGTYWSWRRYVSFR